MKTGRLEHSEERGAGSTEIRESEKVGVERKEAGETKQNLSTNGGQEGEAGV